MKFTLHPGEAFERVRHNATAHISLIDPDKATTITIEPYKKPRSSKQNATLFGVKYPPLMEFMGLSGKREADELHEFFCGEFFGWRSYDIMGKRKQRPIRTTTTDEEGKRSVLKTNEFIDFVEYIDRRAAEQGCVLPDPDPMFRR